MNQARIILVEFDNFFNEEWDPPGPGQGQHVGVNNGSVSSVAHAFWDADLTTGTTANAWINYNATTKNLSVGNVL